MEHSRNFVVVGCNKEKTFRNLGFSQENLLVVKTRDAKGRPLSYSALKSNVDRFIRHAQKNPNDTFRVTPVGVGLEGVTSIDVAPMFALAPSNCKLPKKWETLLPEAEGRVFWFC